MVVDDVVSFSEDDGVVLFGLVVGNDDVFNGLV